MGHLSCVFWLSFYWKNKGWAGWFSGFMAYFFSMFPGISHSHGNKRLLFPISVTMVQTGQARQQISQPCMSGKNWQLVVNLERKG